MTVKRPEGVWEIVVTVRVELPAAYGVMETVAGFRFAVGPFVVGGDTVAVRPMVPVKPLTLANVIAKLLDDPGGMNLKVGEAVALNPTTMTVTVVCWKRKPLVPVTVAV